MAQVEFEQIPNSLRKPGVYTEYNNKEAVTALPTNEQEVLIVAPMIGATTEFSAPQKIFSDAEAESLFGAGSMAHLMVRQAIKNNPNARLTVVGLKNHSAGIAATGRATFSGVATYAGVVSVVIGGEAYEVSAAKGEAVRAIIQRLVVVINASRYCPAQASLASSGTELTLTAKVAGELGNEISLTVKNTAKGLTVTPTAFAGGQRNAQIANALTSVAGTHYNVIISAFSDEENALALRTHLEVLANPIEDKPAIGVMGWRGSFATGTTFTSRLNSERITVAWYKGAVESNALIAAGYGALIAGEEDPAMPLNTLEVKGLSLVDDGQKPLFSEVNQALFNGLSPIEVVAGRVRITRAITTYTKSANNTDDPSYLDLTTPRSLDYVRKAIQTRQRLRFPRAKNSPRMPKKVRSEILDVLYKLEESEIIENVDAWKDRLIVSKNATDPTRLDLDIPADVVNGLHIIANKITLIL